MGRRDDRLHNPEAFRQALMTKPVSRKGPFLVYRIPSSCGPRIGFVIPKKLARHAVQRNQIKRWARAIFRHPDHAAVDSFAFVLRLVQALPASQWLSCGRQNTREAVGLAMAQALEADVGVKS